MILSGRKTKVSLGDLIVTDIGLFMFVYDESESKFPFILISLEDAMVVECWDELPTVKEMEKDGDLIISQIISHKNVKISIS